MKKSTLITAFVICCAFACSSARAAVAYWDSNGAIPGAGDTPNGTWDPFDAPYFWTSDPTGSSPTNAWVEGDSAVFCAGSDATNAYTVGINGFPTVSGITFKDGAPTLSGGGITITNTSDYPIDAQTDAIIDSSCQMVDVSGNCGFKKTGPGNLSLLGDQALNGVNTVAEGIVSMGSAGSLGYGSSTVVSNGGTLQVATSAAISEQVFLNGPGVGDVGALQCIATNPVNNSWTGGAQLSSNATIGRDGPGNWVWSGSYNIEGTNGGDYDLTLNCVSGNLRLNIAGPYNRSINVGTAKIIKNGNGRLQLENPSICSGGFYFNAGEIYPRYAGFGDGPIYVANSPYVAFMALPNTSPSVFQQIVLAPGANLLFDCRKHSTQGTPLTFTCTGVISGSGGVSMTNFGQAIFTVANTYNGNTTILGNPVPGDGAGTLVLKDSGSIANSAVIDVQLNGTFDVAGVTNPNPFVLQAAQTLKGDGTVVGNVTADGTISPGDSIGNLTFNNDLTIAGNLAIEVDRGGPSNDTVTVTGALANTGAGAVLVTNVGVALQPGDSFTIFNQVLVNGQAMAVVGGGVVWTNELASSGKITVLAAAPVPATNLTAAVAGPTSTLITGVGAPNTAYAVFASTDVTTPMANWTLIGTAVADGSGVIQFTDTQAIEPEKYYRFGQ